MYACDYWCVAKNVNRYKYEFLIYETIIMPKLCIEKLGILQTLNSHFSDVTTCDFDNALRFASGSRYVCGSYGTLRYY